MKLNSRLFLLVVFALWAVCAVLNIGGQRQIFHDEGGDLLSDYWMPRTCLAEGYAETCGECPTFAGMKRSGFIEGEMRVAAHDRCYPALALLPLKVFPASWGGAWAWSILSMLVLIGTLCGLSRSAAPLLLLLSMPVLYNIERGNQVVLTAAFVSVFLAWYRSATRWKWAAAILALSLATCLKMSPAVLGLLYLRERDWKAIGSCIIVTSVLFFVPFLFVPGGFAGIPLMLENAQANGRIYARTADFGLIPLWRTLRVLLHQDCTHVWSGCLLVANVTRVLGLAAIAWAAWRRHVLMLVVGLLWAAGNMHYYGVIYLLPVLVLTQPFRSRLSVLLWFVILCPLQLVVMGSSANTVLCNLAAVLLCFIPETRRIILDALPRFKTN